MVKVNGVAAVGPLRLVGVGRGNGKDRRGVVVVPDEALGAGLPSSMSPVASDRVTVKPSSGSTSVSPLTSTVIVAVPSPAAKLTWPEGNAPPKSAASAASAPEPVTA